MVSPEELSTQAKGFPTNDSGCLGCFVVSALEVFGSLYRVVLVIPSRIVKLHGTPPSWSRDFFTIEVLIS